MNISLDLEKGGTIAKNLRSLYLYMIQILTEADVKKNIEMFDEVIPDVRRPGICMERNR